MTLRFMSAGAAQGLVDAIAREYDVPVGGTFGAVGAMLEKLDAGEPRDIVILHARAGRAPRRAVARPPAKRGLLGTFPPRSRFASPIPPPTWRARPGCARR